MAVVDGYKEAPYQGVSQAPAQVRLPSQAELIENALVSIPDGLTPRPPFVYRGTILTSNARSDGLFEYIASHDAILSVNTESGAPVVRVFNYSDLSAPSLTVTSAAHTYLNAHTPTPAVDFGKLSVADYTFLWNRQLPVALDSGTSAARAKEAIVWVKQSAYGRHYEITLTHGGNVKTGTFDTPDGSHGADSLQIDTDHIASELYDSLVTAGADSVGLGGGGYTLELIGSAIYIKHPTLDFTVIVKDGQAGLALIAVKDNVQSFSDLPRVGKDGFTVRISDQSNDDSDDYFVEYMNTAGTGTGIWQETIAPGANKGVDPHTLPIALTFDGAAWTLDVQAWSQRLVGNADLSPDPGFIGETIADMTFWRGRVAMLYKESVLFSSSEDPFRIYPMTLTAVLDSDPIELTSPYPETSLLRYATLYDKRLVLSGDKAHLFVEADQAATPQTTRIDVLFAAELIKTLRPQPTKTRLYFASPRGDDSAAAFATVNEVSVNQRTDTAEPEDMTTVLPRYVPADLDRVASCAVQFLMCYGKSGGTQIIPHLYRYNPETEERLQNCWSTWTLPEGYVLGGMFFRKTVLVMLLVDEAGAGHLVECNTTPAALDPGDGATLLTHWDMRVSEDQVELTYDADTDTTSAVLPYTPSSAIQASVAAPGGMGGPALSTELLPANEGQLIDVVSVDADTKTVTLSGDWSDCPLFIGEPFSMRWTPSRIFMMDQNNKPIRSGRLTIQRVLFDVADTGYLRVEVTAGNRNPRVYEFTGYRWDDPASHPDTPPSSDAKFPVPMHSDTEALSFIVINDSHFTCKVLGFNWIGKFTPRAQRVG